MVDLSPPNRMDWATLNRDYSEECFGVDQLFYVALHCAFDICLHTFMKVVFALK